jgi:sugar lactone lactonase YvrE
VIEDGRSDSKEDQMSSQQSAALEGQPLLSGLVIGESPRWHEGRLWFAHWGTEEIVAVDREGRSEVVAHGPPGLGWSIDWLPDGRLLVTGETLMRREPDGSMVRHADLSGVGVDRFNEIVVDGRGNIYVNGGNDFNPGEGQAPGIIALVTPDGSARRVADGIAFPNGMAVTPDNSTLIIAESFAGRLTAFDIAADGSLSNRRVWADGVGPDGICVDAEGAIWTGVGDMGDNLVGRVRDGGEVLEQVQLEMPCFACMLGGDDGKTLFMLAADWRIEDGFADNIARLTTGPRTGRVLTAPAPTPGAGWP